MEYLNNVRFDYELVQYHLSSCGHIGHESLTQCPRVDLNERFLPRQKTIKA